jgi:hypothetical protein
MGSPHRTIEQLNPRVFSGVFSAATRQYGCEASFAVMNMIIRVPPGIRRTRMTRVDLTSFDPNLEGFSVPLTAEPKR